MHVKAFKLPSKNPLFYPNNRIFVEGYTDYREVRGPTHIHPVCGMETHEPLGIAKWSDPPDRNGFHNHPHCGGNVSEQLLNGYATAVQQQQISQQKESSLFNLSRGRSDRQGGRWGDNHRRTK